MAEDDRGNGKDIDPIQQQRDSNRHTLLEMLDVMQKTLYAIVLHLNGTKIDEPKFHNQNLRFRREFMPLFPGPWDEVAGAFNQASKSLREDNFDWEYVEVAGLTKTNLAWKKQVFDEAIGEGIIRRILKVMNSLLDSLSGAIPVLEIVKEYKDLAEAAIRYPGE